MPSISEFWQVTDDACRAYESALQTTLSRARWRSLLNPSIRASVVFTMASRASRSHVLWRNWAVRSFSSDVSKGAHFDGPPILPHPIGIVVGRGTRVGRDVTLYQNVTLGTDASGRYPKVGDGTIIYTNAVVYGGVKLTAGTRIRAAAVVGPAPLHGVPDTR
ncbi:MULTISPECIES: hypothetical protein [Nocardiaceae]|uniref:Serine O-acetyltransferase n=1 Tax=Rhodococcoides corynebacterioides TaxID=53972 RepID=A0ABS2KZ83_9NOCA|nr:MULTISPECIES: hypothetical protein [Rhodococcus]MBM7417253.1 serine O-acetyltransferase [Rhodococcus corynebacterioides]MBP1115506.1 serine O-acetyltransferase [Rhodococcus sp. PvP016]